MRSKIFNLKLFTLFTLIISLNKTVKLIWIYENPWNYYNNHKTIIKL